MEFVKNLLIPHHKNKYRPHIIRRHGLFIAVMLVIGAQLINTLQINAQSRVLGYATNITINGLLSSTNSERQSAGVGTLKLNSKLNAAAQAKANDMIEDNYWSHTAPDGTTPWYWFDWAGYAYLVAGENLAYGFDTSAGVVEGWMNSPSHKDNMLNSVFEDVGFGIANGENFQGGPNTVVVAMYGDPVETTQTTPPPSSQTTTNQSPPPPSTPPAPEPTPVQQEQSAPETTNPVVQAEEEQEPAKQTPQEEEITPVTFASTEEHRISNLEALLTGQAHIALYVSSLITTLLGIVYAYRHILLVHNAIIKGEQFVMAHPMLEAGLIYIIAWLLLSSTFGSVL